MTAGQPSMGALNTDFSCSHLSDNEYCCASYCLDSSKQKLRTLRTTYVDCSLIGVNSNSNNNNTHAGDTKNTRGARLRSRRPRSKLPTPRNNKSRYRKSQKKHVNEALDRRSYITNLSSRTLSPTEMALLAKGLKYVPSVRADPHSLNKALDSFDRLNRRRYFFRDSENSEQHPFRQKSAWIPPPASVEIEN